MIVHKTRICNTLIVRKIIIVTHTLMVHESRIRDTLIVHKIKIRDKHVESTRKHNL